MQDKGFPVTDYLIFFASIGISFGIGIFFAIFDRKKVSTTDYFLAGKKSKTIPAALSFVVTFQSSMLILSSPAEVYVYGLKYVYLVIAIAGAYAFAGLTIVPVFHPLNITSIYKYFELRYKNNVVRYLAVSTGLIYTLFYMGTVTYGTCVALEAIIGVPYWATVLVYSVITSVYTSVGGIKAVIWTDTFQFIIMTAGVVAVLVFSTMEAGGVSSVWKLANDRLDLNSFSFNPTVRYTFWNLGFACFTSFLYITYSPAGMQRIRSTPEIRSARFLYIISGPIYGILYCLSALQGVTIFAYHVSKGCDILESGQIKNLNELLPVTVLELFQKFQGMTGLFLASLSCAALSTLSSCLNSMSAITYEDIVKVKFPNISEKKATFVSKIVVLLYGMVGIALTFLVAKIPGTATTIFTSIIGCMDGPTAAMFLLSMMSRRVTTKGVFVGAVTGMVTTLWIILGQAFSNLPPDPKLPPGPTYNCTEVNPAFYDHLRPNHITTTPDVHVSTEAHNLTLSLPTEAESVLTPLQTLYNLSYTLFSFTGFSVTIVIASIVSVFTKPTKDIDDRCLFSFQKHLQGKLFNKSRHSVSAEEQALVSSASNNHSVAKEQNSVGAQYYQKLKNQRFNTV